MTAAPLPAPSIAAPPAPRAAQLGLVGCHACGLASTWPGGAGRVDCPRCGSPLHLRKPAGRTRSTALLLAAAVCYLVSMVLPVMHTAYLGGSDDSTILAGVLEFWRAGDWDIAAIIFVASVVVPCAKFAVLGFLLGAAPPPRARIRAPQALATEQARRDKARLYRLVEFIGYWSMLDVVVVALLASAVQFGQLSEVAPRAGIAWFGAAVVLTMLAAMRFDAREIWDEQADGTRHPA